MPPALKPWLCRWFCLAGLWPLYTGAADVRAPVCSSDGQPAPQTLVERFLNADCADCWRARPAALPAGALAIDWIVPSAAGDEAPLSAAAIRDSAQRLDALGLASPEAASEHRGAVATVPLRLRVALGPALGGYVGTSIRATPGVPLKGGPWTLWLLLVEALPAGTEGTPVARSLARNLLVVPWTRPVAGQAFTESRPMAVPEGSHSERLQVLGWVQDGQGRVIAAARSTCRR